MTTNFYILDAADLRAGPLAVLRLPVHVPYGLHSAYVPEDLLVP